MLKYQTIANQLAEEILNADFNDKLPSEFELMERFSVSRNTIRNALNVLYNQGMVKRIQGSGYFVNHALNDNSGNVMNLANKVGLDALGKRYYPVESQVLALEIIPAGPDIAKLLICDEQEPLYFVKRLRSSHHQLISIEEAYYLKKEVPYLTKEICEHSIFSFIMKNYNIEIKNADEYIAIHPLTPDEARLSGLPVGHPTLKVEEVNFLKNSQPFNYSRTYHFQQDLTLYYHVSNYLR